MNRTMQWFKSDHLKGPAKNVSRACGDLAHQMDRELGECAEKTAGLRKLLEAKDCFVRARTGEQTGGVAIKEHDRTAIDLVIGERGRQDEKWGADRTQSFGHWLQIMMEEVGEASAANLEGEDPMRVLEELTQATAVGLAWMAMLIRQASGA